MKMTAGLALLSTVLLTACLSQPVYIPYSGVVAPPQVVYRIDDNRYFEIVPLQDMPCARARLYYTDKAKGIHANLASSDRVDGNGTFIIDAANDQYLVAPIILSSSGCQSGGMHVCINRLYYSQDSGRTWKVTRSNRGTSMYLTGSTLYMPIRNHGGWILNIEKDIADDQKWDRYPEEGSVPQPKKNPIDNRFHCTREKE